MNIFKTGLLILLTFFISETMLSQKLYKEMMQDPSYNFYDVCKEAESYFVCR